MDGQKALCQKVYPEHIINARKAICAVVTSLSIKWFSPDMWADDDPQDVKDQTSKMYRWANSCIKLATSIKLAPISKITIKKQDSFIRKYASSLIKLDKDRVLQTKRAISLLEVANITQCNVVLMSHDKREWNWLYQSTRKLLEKFLYPFYPETEDDGMGLYLQMVGH